jgi:SAM-dependent methyltransferase
VYEKLVDVCGLGPGTRVLEIGPGTGQATVPVLRLGAHVVGVELGPRLAARLRARTTGLPLDVVVGDFESVDVPGGPFDLAVSATAFHWLDPALALPKIAGLLQSDGWLALWWTHFGPLPGDTTEASVAIDEVCRRYEGLEGPTAPWVLDVDHVRSSLTDGRHFEVTDVELIEWDATHTGPELRDLSASHSPVLALEPETRAALLDDLESLVDERFGGSITRQYVTPIYIARRR